jgi:hypothetical protein
MSESTPAPTPAPEPITPEASGGFFQNLIDLYFAPREAFTRIVARPAWVLPLLGATVLAAAFTGIWLQKMEPREFMKTQLQESGQWDKIPAEQRENIIEQQAKFMPMFAWPSSIVGTALFLAVIAGVLLFIYRFFYAGEVGYKQALAITSWSFFAVSLVTTPLTGLVMALKGDWNLNPQEVLQANLGLLMDKAETAKPLWALLTSLDLVSFWIIFLLASGFAVAVRKKTGSALWGVVVPWAVVVAIKVGWNAIF